MMTSAATLRARPTSSAPWLRRALSLATFSAVLSPLLLACQNERVERKGEPAAAPSASTSVGAAQPSSPQQSSVQQSSVQPSSPQPSSPQPAALSRPREPLNVLLITVEAWRADMPWRIGAGREVAPQLTSWVEQSVLWENHRAVSSHTPQSLAALSAGRMPSTLYRDGALFPTYAAENVFLPEVLQAKGIRTLSVQTDPRLGQGKGFEQGFDVWESLSSSATPEQTSERAVARLTALLGQPPNTTRQFFAWLHLNDPEEPYLSGPQQPSFGSGARARYDGEIHTVDTALGKLLEFARQQPWWARTAVILTGAHGEALGEHGMSQHGQELWDVLLATPLIIRAPGAAPARLGAARSQLDLAPTIVELMGLPGQEQHQGQSLLPELYGKAQAERASLLFELCEDVEQRGMRAMIAGDEKLIVPGKGDERLFNLKADPGETKNLAESQPARLRTMAVRFEGEWRRVPSVQPYGGMKLRSGRAAEGPRRPARAP